VQIVVDGLPVEVSEGATVLQILKQLGEPTSHIIVEVNGSFVHPKSYGRTRLEKDDRVEVVYPAFGG